MKSYREIKVAVLAIVCLFLLFFGFNFLKGVNIFTPISSYTGYFEQLGGLTEQAPVYIRGYKVGQVDRIQYDFSKQQAFLVSASVNSDIHLTQGSEMVLVSDGLLGGKAIEIVIPVGDSLSIIARGSELPTRVEEGLMESLQSQLLAHVDSVVIHIDTLLASVQSQLEGDHIKRTLQNVDHITTDLKVSSTDLKQLTHQRLPQVVDSVQQAVSNANRVLTSVADADLKGTIARIDTVAEQVSTVITSREGTLGKLLYDKTLYNHIDSAIVSADNLLIDLKANPKRYVHFSVFGNKEKKKKK
ncbi:MAG: MCE family protein [Paludibacteraceae bacterium]|nr:MCE family protein [Paludibacteraceae bacterium]